jgi:subtilase family serine protease
VVLDVNASVSDIEQAFGVHLQSYQHPVENRVFFAPDNEPTLAETVPILDISGLDDFRLPRPLVHKVQNAAAQNATPAFGSGPGGTYRGNDFRAAYAPNVTVNGAGQIVGLLEFDGYYASDISSYESQAGLPNVPLSNVLLDSFNGTPGGANIEVALDIEVAIAMAPGLSQVIVYEAGPSGFPNDILTRMVSDNLAKQLSSSWTWSGGPNGTTDSLFQQMAAQGQSFFQASGDSDAYTSSIPQPSDSPYITVVGGTTLSTSGAGGAWSSETTWNWFNNGSGTNGSSGGISTSYSIPSWQQSVSMAGNQGSTTMLTDCCQLGIE